MNGVQAGQLAIAGAITTSTGALKIGGNSIWGEWFQGEIDEVRIYNRALTATEITGDMNTSISAPDTQAPSAPGTLTATGGLGQIGLSWGAATDNVGVARYNVHRGTSAGFTPSAGNRIAQPTGHELHRLGPRSRHLLLQGHRRGLRRQRRAGRKRGNARSPQLTRRRRPCRSRRRARAHGQRTRSPINASASDNGTVAGVQFKLDGANLGAEDTALPTRSPGTRSRSRTARTPSPRSPATPPATPRPPRTSSSPPRTPARPASSPPRASTRAAARRPPTSPATATPARSANATVVDDRQVQQRALLQRHERLGHRRPTRPRST